MRVVNQQVPTPFRDIDLRHADAAELRRVSEERRAAAAARGRPRRAARRQPARVSIDGHRRRARGGRCRPASTPASGIEEYLDEVLGDPDRTNDFRLLENELYLTATDLDTCERIVLGGEDWDDVPISRAVAASTALPMVYKPVEIKGRQLDRRRHPLDHQRRHRRRARREVRHRREPARPVRQRLPEGDPDDDRLARAPRLRHGVPPDRLPVVQAARPPAPARGRAALAGEVPGRRHHPDRARPERRADVRHEHHELHQARRHRPPRLRVRDAQARGGLRPPPRGLRQARHRDLRHARAQGGPPLRARERETTRAWRRILEQTTGALLRQSEDA